MFTGIIEEIGAVRRVSTGAAYGTIEIAAGTVLEGTRLGDSIAVNGVCLTVTGLSGDGFTADVMAETMRRSALGLLKSGSRVNLERAMAADGRFGGHIVSGHIDGVGQIRENGAKAMRSGSPLQRPPQSCAALSPKAQSLSMASA